MFIFTLCVFVIGLLLSYFAHLLCDVCNSDQQWGSKRLSKIVYWLDTLGIYTVLFSSIAFVITFFVS